jgi:integrase
MKKRPANPIKQPSKVLDIQDYLREQNERDYVLFVLGVATGYRAGDLVSLQIRDVKEALRAGYFRIMEGKKLNSKNIRKSNMKPREVVIVSKLEKVLKNYIKGKNDYEYMFPSRKGSYDHIGVARVSTILKEAGEAFGLDNISAHSMRKTYAYCIFIECDRDILVVKEMLGHSSIEETKRYLGLNRQDFDNYSKSLNALIL